MKKLIFFVAAALILSLSACSEKETIKDEKIENQGTRSAPDGDPICGTKKAIQDTIKIEPKGDPICGTK